MILGESFNLLIDFLGFTEMRFVIVVVFLFLLLMLFSISLLFTILDVELGMYHWVYVV